MDHISPAPPNMPSESTWELSDEHVFAAYPKHPWMPELASSQLLCSPLFRSISPGLLLHLPDPPQLNKLLFTLNLDNQQGRRCEHEHAIASPLMVNREAGRYVQKRGVNGFQESRKTIKSNKRLHSTLYNACMHSFIHYNSLIPSAPHPASQPTYSVAMHFSPSRHLNGMVSLGLFPPSPQICMCLFPPLFSFPMAVFFFLFQKETYENC